MRTVLHILTKPDDAMAREIVAQHERGADGDKIMVADLTGLQPDYKQLLENIFVAESVQVW